MAKLNNFEPPKDTRQWGEALFNYASYDGRYFIGTAPWIFEMKWSSAGRGTAHLLNDPASIDGVAIAEGVRTIGQVTPAVVAGSDFTSRHRSPEVGQVAILKNTAGFVAAVELIEVGHSPSPSENIMRLRFAIQTDQSSDFSSFASKFDGRQRVVSELLAATSDAERAIEAVEVSRSTNSDEINIGHNGPPSEFAITEGDRTEALEAIYTIREEVTTASPSSNKLKAAGQKIARLVGTIASWVSTRAKLVADDIITDFGKTLIISVWTTLLIKLTELMGILANFIG